jgi:hypothetical protein
MGDKLFHFLLVSNSFFSAAVLCMFSLRAEKESLESAFRINIGEKSRSLLEKKSLN